MQAYVLPRGRHDALYESMGFTQAYIRQNDRKFMKLYGGAIDKLKLCLYAIGLWHLQSFKITTHYTLSGL